MKGSEFSGTVECWRGTGKDEMPVEVFVRLRAYPAPPEEGRGFEVDVLEASAGGEPFRLTDAEVDRAFETLAREAVHAR